MKRKSSYVRRKKVRSIIINCAIAAGILTFLITLLVKNNSFKNLLDKEKSSRGTNKYVVFNTKTFGNVSSRNDTDNNYLNIVEGEK